MADFGSFAPSDIPSVDPTSPDAQALAAALGKTWPAKLAQSTWGALTLPGDVYAGKTQIPSAMGVPGAAPADAGEVRMEPNSFGSLMGMTGGWSAPGHESPIARSADLAGLVMSGTGASAPAGAVGAGPVRRAASLPMDHEARMARAAEQGFEGPWYHGSMRTDRLTEKGAIDPRRATSGPMPYFTDSPEMAAGYAMGKKGDTSLADFGNVQDYFHVSPSDLWPGTRSRSPITVEQSWHYLPPETRADILSKAKRVGYENFQEASGPYTLHPPGVEATLSPDHFDYLMQTSARRNPLSALREMWHDGGNLVGSEGDLSTIFKLAGYPHPISEAAAPWTEARGILPAMLAMRNPLHTENQQLMSGEVLPALERAFARDRSRKQEYGADMWDKNTRFTPREWVQNAKEDYAKGDNSFVWTSVPDKITAQLRAMGYDGLIDTGGKMGGQSHKVAIPFGPEQVRSIFAAFNPANIGKKNLLGAGAPYPRSFGSLSSGGDE
jgi:hypothetical protein